MVPHYGSSLSSLGVPGVPWHTQILADQLTLFLPGGTDYAHLITTGTTGFSDLLTALSGDLTEHFHGGFLSPLSKILAVQEKKTQEEGITVLNYKVRCSIC